MLQECILLIFAYMVGGFPIGYWFARYCFGIDITQYGSGNIGASNIARVLGKRYFLLVFLSDALKAYAVLKIGEWCGLYVTNSILPYLVAAGLLIGNAYSIFLSLRGGKGVATMIGIFMYLLSLGFVIGCSVCWLVIVGLTKKPFIASLGSVGGLIVAYGLFIGDESTFFYIALFCWIIFRHTANIREWFKASSSVSKP